MKRLLLLLSVFWRGCASLTSGPPLLDAGDELLVKAGEPLSLNCTGSKPLHWKTPHQEMNYTVTGSPTESTLAVRELESFDTGYFYCHYENAADFESDKDNVDSTYVYVHDETGTGFVKQHLQNETVRAFGTLVIDCTVTHPDLNITLWYNKAQITSQDRVSYDPRKGFTVKTLRHEGTYTCKDGRGHEISKQIAVTAARQIVIEMSGEMNQEYVRGYSFEQNCWNLDTVDAQLTWTYPNPKAEHRVYQGRLIVGYQWSTLKVQNASDSDTGDYTCSASVPGFLPNNASRHITIVRALQIREPRIYGGMNQEYVRGDSFKLKCWNEDYVAAQWTWTYPNPNAEHRVEQGRNDWYSTLTVQKASDSHTGQYTCSVSAPDYLPNSNSVNITIKGRPHMKMSGAPFFSKKGMSLIITCSAVGFPPADVSLLFQDCSSGSESCSPPVKVPQTGEENTAILAPGNIVEKNMTFSPNTSGLLWCYGENILGTGNTSTSVSISVQGVSKGVQVALTISLVGSALLVLVVVVLLTQVKKERRKAESFKAMRDRLIKGNIGQLNPNCTVEQQAVNLPYDESRWEVPRRNITPGKLLGSGTFGQVIKATVKDLEFRATPTSTTVAIKMCKNPTFKQMEAFIMELKILIHLGKHLNIVNLMGASTVQCDQDLWILLEYCRFGDLLNFMKRHRGDFIDQIDAATGQIDFERTAMKPSSPLSHSSRTSHVQAPIDTQASMAPSSPQSALPASPPGHCAKAVHPSTVSSDNSSTNLTQQTSSPLSPTDSCFMGEAHSDPKGKAFTYEVGSVPGISAPFSTRDLLSWGWQAAQGMAYLSNRNILHGDLAARNLLLADNNVVKISDFGMSRDVYKDNVYKKKKDALMPIKWMSVEGIRDRIFSVQSDVWAFGITLWEIFSLGGSPYPDIECTGLLRHLEDGHRMGRPKYANEDIHRVMMECWKAKPMERPTFYQLVDILGFMMPSEFKEEYLITNGVYCYIQMNEERFKDEPDYISMMTNPTFEKMTRAAEPDGPPHEDDQEQINNSASVEIELPCRVSYTPGERCPSNISTGSNYLPMKGSLYPACPSGDAFSPMPQ